MREEESDEEVLEVEKSNQSGGISGKPIIVYLVYLSGIKFYQIKQCRQRLIKK